METRSEGKSGSIPDYHRRLFISGDDGDIGDDQEVDDRPCNSYVSFPYGSGSAGGDLLGQSYGCRRMDRLLWSHTARRTFSLLACNR